MNFHYNNKFSSQWWIFIIVIYSHQNDEFPSHGWISISDEFLFQWGIFVIEFLSSEPELLHLGSVCLSVCRSKKCQKCQKLSKKCQNMSKKCQNMSYKIGRSVHLSICLSVGQKNVKKCQKSVKTCQKGIKTCQNMSKMFQTLSKQVKERCSVFNDCFAK